MIQEAQRIAILRDLAATGSGAAFTCNSGSMEPTIRVGEQVRVRAVPEAAIRVGDVVVYRGARDFMLHRIVLIAPSRTWFLHIGDAPSTRAPGRAAMASIIGVVDLPRKLPPARVYARAARHALRAYLYW